MTILSKVVDRRPTLGCDPEFFFSKNGEVIGAEKVLPKGGLKDENNSKIIIDGVQAELNPAPTGCRAIMSNNISACFRKLKDSLKDGVTVDFSRTIEISKENLEQLDDASRQFGCAPSNTAYEGKAGIKIDSIDPSEYRTRAAGGHLHFGHYGNSSYPELCAALTKAGAVKTVHLLDIICGNTCVLIDRDPSNIERRKLYGRAGEYRLPSHGLEYRTLSNFWLQSYPLMSIAMGLGRLAVQLAADPINGKQFYEAFTSAVNMDEVYDAINNNDYDLALKNFNAIAPLLEQVCPDTDGFPVGKSTMKEFRYFFEAVNEKGLTHWFKDDPFTHWTDNTKRRNPVADGGKSFLMYTVRPAMVTETAPKVEKTIEAIVIKKPTIVKTKGLEIMYADELVPTVRQTTRYRANA